MPLRWTAALAALAALVSLGAGCNDREDLDGTRRRPPGMPERPPVYEVPLDGRRVAYDLYDNRIAAAVHAGGALAIDATGVPLMPYIEGGYRSPWHVGLDIGGRRAAAVDGLAGELYFPVDADAGGVRRGDDGSLRVSWRARAAVDDQLVSVFLNEHRLTDVAMPSTDWTWYHVTAPGSVVRDGENKLRFYFRSAGELGGVRTAAAFDRIAAGGRPPDAIVAAGTAALASGTLPALSTRGDARLSFYTRVPSDSPALVLAYAGAGQTLSVRVRPEGTAAADTAWEATGKADWQRAEVDLGAHAGHIVRLDLISDGPVHWGRPRVVAAAPAEPTGERPLADTVIVWTISSLRADRADDMPNLMALAGQGARSDALIAAAPSPGAAHVAMLTGRYPQGDALPEGAPTLGERFSAAGYESALVSGNGFVHDEAGFARGFDHYDNPMRLRRPFGAAALWQRAKQLLARREGKKAFVYLATVEPHLPWTPSPEALAGLWDPTTPVRFAPSRTADIAEAVRAGRKHLISEERAYMRALYDAQVREADAALGQMRRDLHELGIADRTAIVIAGDHGQELFERGNAGHGYTLYQEVLAAPLVVWFPGAIEPQVIRGPVEAADVYATVLELGGIAPNPEAQGTSLLPRLGGGGVPAAAFAHLPGRGRAVLAGDYKLIVPRFGPHELYDLSADPGEQREVSVERPIATHYLRTLLGLRVAYESAWNRRRWGTPGQLEPAFSADHGL